MDDFANLGLRREKLSEQVASKIEQMIVEETFIPGDRMPSERSLAEQIGVSRTVVREAIQVLSERGLVQIRQGSGIYVQKLVPADAAEPIRRLLRFQEHSHTFQSLCEVRHTLEIEIAGLAAVRSTEGDLIEIEKTIKQIAEASENAKDFAKGDLDFHMALAAATHNDLFLVLLTPISDLFLEFLVSGYEYDLEQAVRGSTYHHQNILDEIKKRDSEGARDAMRKHLKEAVVLFDRATKNIS